MVGKSRMEFTVLMLQIAGENLYLRGGTVVCRGYVSGHFYVIYLALLSLLSASVFLLFSSLLF